MGELGLARLRASFALSQPAEMRGREIKRWILLLSRNIVKKKYEAKL